MNEKKLRKIRAWQLVKQESMVPDLIAGFGLAIICLIAYFPELGNAFVEWDGLHYIREISLVGDISFESIRKKFFNYLLGNYQPFTALSLCISFASHSSAVFPLIGHPVGTDYGSRPGQLTIQFCTLAPVLLETMICTIIYQVYSRIHAAFVGACHGLGDSVRNWDTPRARPGYLG
jgi:hypothetical protein